MARLPCGRLLCRRIACGGGGEPGSRLAARLSMSASGDTLLRLVRATEREPPPSPRVVGIDDWAWRRGRCHRTIVCDIERGRVIDLLPDRSAEAVAPASHDTKQTRLRADWRARRLARYEERRRLHGSGVSVQEIAPALGMSAVAAYR